MNPFAPFAPEVQPRAGLALALTLALTLAAGASRADDQKLEFAVKSVVSPLKDGEQPAGARVEAPRETSTTLTVVLGSDRLSIQEGEGARRLVDFAARRMKTIDPAAKTIEDDSLYSVVGFRVFEFQNRIQLGQALGGAGVKTNPIALTLSEHLFALDDGKTPSKIDRQEKGETVTFSYEGKPLLSYHKDDLAPAAPAEVARFVQFVRYHFGGHPEILADLAALKGIPRHWTLTRYDVGKSTATDLALRAIGPPPEGAFSLDGLHPPKPPEGDKLAALIARARSEGPEAFEARAKAIRQAANKALADGRVFDAFLGAVELGLQTGNQTGIDLAPHQQKLRMDPDLRELTSALRPENADAARQSVQTLERLRGRSKTSAHVLKIIEANNRSALGEVDAARTLFLEALDANPVLTGAWKDLGDLFLRQYNTQSAWRCWDLARTLAPKHSLVQPIADLEQKLAADHPEYFTTSPPKA